MLSNNLYRSNFRDYENLFRNKGKKTFFIFFSCNPLGPDVSENRMLGALMQGVPNFFSSNILNSPWNVGFNGYNQYTNLATNSFKRIKVDRPSSFLTTTPEDIFFSSTSTPYSEGKKTLYFFILI